MKQCAIVLNGNDVVKISNLKRKYNKLASNPNIEILEECDAESLEERYSYWSNKKKTTDIEDSGIRLYHFKNDKTGYTITSIYPDLEDCKSYIKDWNEYRREY